MSNPAHGNTSFARRVLNKFLTTTVLLVGVAKSYTSGGWIVVQGAQRARRVPHKIRKLMDNDQVMNNDHNMDNDRRSMQTVYSLWSLFITSILW